MLRLWEVLSLLLTCKHHVPASEIRISPHPGFEKPEYASWCMLIKNNYTVKPKDVRHMSDHCYLNMINTDAVVIYTEMTLKVGWTPVRIDCFVALIYY